MLKQAYEAGVIKALIDSGLGKALLGVGAGGAAGAGATYAGYDDPTWQNYAMNVGLGSALGAGAGLGIKSYQNAKALAPTRQALTNLQDTSRYMQNTESARVLGNPGRLNDGAGLLTPSYGAAAAKRKGSSIGYTLPFLGLGALGLANKDTGLDYSQR